VRTRFQAADGRKSIAPLSATSTSDSVHYADLDTNEETALREQAVTRVAPRVVMTPRPYAGHCVAMRFFVDLNEGGSALMKITQYAALPCARHTSHAHVLSRTPDRRARTRAR
jgi:hypothetical protein